MGRKRITNNEQAAGDSLGKVLSERRRRLRLTQATLAKAASVDLDSLRGIEGGKSAKPSFFTIMKLAAILGITAEQIVRSINRMIRTCESRKERS